MEETPRWLSYVPGFCETCDGPITKKFYDAKTIHGPWACMCPSCFTLGPGIGELGPGLGQEYTYSPTTKHWEKTNG
jgi:hypothetical protein